MRVGWAARLVVVVALAGCGGGGGGSAPPYAPTTTSPSPVPTTTSPSPVPTATGVAAPTVGYLPGSGTSFSGTTSASARSVTVAPVSEKLIPQPMTPAFLQTSIRVDVNAGSAQSTARRATDVTANVLAPSAPRVSLSAERLVNSTWMRNLASALRRTPAATATATPSATPAPGSARTFAVLSGGIGPSATSYVNIATTLLQTTAHSYLYVDNSLGLSASVVSAIANDFENAYLSDTTHFGTSDYPGNAPNGPLNGTGTPCDSNGIPIAGATPIPVTIPDTDGHTYVVVVSQANAGNGEGGYFDPANYFVQAFANCYLKTSNQLPMIVLVWPRSADVNYETQEDMVRISAHEFQHLINFVNHCILAPRCGVNNGNPSDDPWLNEGLSMLAQDLAVQQLFPSVTYDVDDALFYAGQFIASPQSFNIGSFAGIDGGTTAPAFNCNGCYGGAYLLERYLYNRFGGDGYTRAMETASGTSKTNLGTVTGQQYETLLGDFSIALMSAQNGLAPTSAFTFPLSPGSLYRDQFGASYSLTSLGIAETTAIGTSTTYTSCQGCFFYVGVPTNLTAVTLKVTDVTATASLAAGILQR